MLQPPNITNITTPFISINLDILQNPLEQCLFLLSHVFIKNQTITFFASFFISMLRMIKLFFVFKNKNCCYLCRFYHECAFELTDWLIWLVHQFDWLIQININLLKLTSCNYYHLRYKYSQSMFNNVLKGNSQLIFLCNTQKSSVNACLMRILKSTVTKKVIVCF